MAVYVLVVSSILGVIGLVFWDYLCDYQNPLSSTPQVSSCSYGLPSFDSVDLAIGALVILITIIIGIGIAIAPTSSPEV